MLGRMMVFGEEQFVGVRSHIGNTNFDKQRAVGIRIDRRNQVTRMAAMGCQISGKSGVAGADGDVNPHRAQSGQPSSQDQPFAAMVRGAKAALRPRC
jgi:hypothetical protein